MAPGVDPAAGVDIEREGPGQEPPDAAAIEPLHACRCFYMAVDVDRLIEEEPGVGAPAEGVDDVVGVFRTETRQHHPPLVSLAITVVIGQVEHLGAVGNITAAVPRQHSGGH